jgi:hypothetical protein
VSTTWELGKVIFPVTLAVSVLQHTLLYDALLSVTAPAMSWIGLPSEAAIPLVLGNLLNLYAAIGAIVAMELTAKQVFILATMLSFSHMLPVEAAVCRRIGVSALAVSLVRLALAAASALAIDRLWDGGGQQVSYGLAAPGGATPEDWGEVLAGALRSATTGVLQLAAIVIPVMVFIRILRDVEALDWFATKMRPLMRVLGIPARGAVIMASGLVFGLAFGAGVILEQAKEQKFTRRELTLMVLFLSACHAVIEDTLIFVPLGVDALALLSIRLAVAVAMTTLIARLWPAEPPSRNVEGTDRLLEEAPFAKGEKEEA